MSIATLKQGTHTLTLIGQQNPEMEHLQVLHDGYLTDLVQAIMEGTVPSRDDFRKALGLGPVDITIEVDYSMTLPEMIAAGEYDWTNSDITSERFPIQGEGKHKRKPKLIHFNRAISSDDAEKELDKMGLRSGKIEELLAFGATHKEMQRKFPIIALGSVTRRSGFRFVAYLFRPDAERGLDLFVRVLDWGEDCRFLAFPK